MSHTNRRRIALSTALLVAWTALWPLVSAAHARLAGEEVMLCHQAGSMVAPGEAPSKMEAGAAGAAPHGPANDGRTHCPLCIMAFYGSSWAPPEVPPLQFSTLSVHLPVCGAPSPCNLEVPLPPSRAPPLRTAG